jgi:hypothetical protein
LQNVLNRRAVSEPKQGPSGPEACVKQSRAMSLLETALSTMVGFAIALATQTVVFPWFGFHPAVADNLAITAVFTVVSIARQYLLRRIFEAISTTNRCAR